MEQAKGSFPINTVMNYEFDSSITIMNSIKNVQSSGIMGLLLASGILFVFLKREDPGIITAGFFQIIKKYISYTYYSYCNSNICNIYIFPIKCSRDNFKSDVFNGIISRNRNASR